MSEGSNSEMNKKPECSIFTEEMAQEPYRTYERMRRECPVHAEREADEYSLMSKGMLWHVTRRSDVDNVLLNRAQFVRDYELALSGDELSRLTTKPRFIALFAAALLDREPPDHTRLRRLVAKVFTPRMVKRLGPKITEITNSLLDKVVGRGHMEAIREFCFPLPIIVISEMLGVPSSDREQVGEWSNILALTPTSLEEVSAAERAAKEWIEYLEEICAQRKRAPQDDLISALLQVEEEGVKLTTDEILGMLALLLLAGHETTVGGISSGIYLLLTHPDQLAQVRTDPGLIEPAVEEILRYESPVYTTMPRWATEDIEVHGCTVRRGERVTGVLAAANRDPAMYADPDRFDIHRKEKNHVAFGVGIHYCLGAPLARLEMKISLAAVLERLPGLRLGVPASDLRWHMRLPIRKLKRLPLEWDPS